MIRFLRSLISNLATLLLALVVALIIWVNASQVEEETVRQNLAIPINVVGIPENGILLKPDLEALQALQIGYEGPESIVSELTVDDFAATLDFSTVPYGQETAVPIQVKINVPEGVTLVFQSAEEVTALLEQSISREIPIELDIRGTVARGHTQGTPLIDPPFITVSGPASSVEQLSTIRLTVFLNNARETQVYSPQIIYYDLQGRVTSTRGLTQSADEVQVTIPVNESAGFAEKFITVARTGEPAPGYRLLNITVEPSSVFVTGPPAQLAALTRVQTEQINLTGLTASTRLQVALDLPAGIELDQDQEVFVDVEIEPRVDTASFRRDVEVIGLGPELEVARIQPEDVRIIFFGPVLALDGLIEGDIRVTVDLFERQEGTYSVEPKVEFPERGIELRSIQPSVVTVEITRVKAITDTLTDTITVTETSRLPYVEGGVTAVPPPTAAPPVANLAPFAYHPSFAYLVRRETT
ncbi:MAG: hypothetical protein H6658_21510 [Ardenticatenaceae bacterium]|nr:hypothetical protein [Ardenticatenaceae bacterium]